MVELEGDAEEEEQLWALSVYDTQNSSVQGVKGECGLGVGKQRMMEDSGAQQEMGKKGSSGSKVLHFLCIFLWRLYWISHTSTCEDHPIYFQ